MTLRRHLVRLMTGLIVLIAAAVAPSAASAHAGHAHAGAQPAPSIVAVPPEATSLAACPTADASRASVGSVRAIEGSGCCAGACGKACCGAMSCSASGMPAGPASLPPPVHAHVVMVADDIVSRPGLGPEAPPEPPRTAA